MLAVEGFTAAFSDPGVSAVVTRTGVPSAKNWAEGSKVCLDGFGLSLSAITYSPAGASIPDPGPVSAAIAATSTKCTSIAEGLKVLRVGDETADIHATPQIPGSPPTPHPITFRVKITAAGQAKVSGE